MSIHAPKNKYDALAHQLEDCARVLRAMGNDADAKKGVYKSKSGDRYVNDVIIPTIRAVVPEDGGMKKPGNSRILLRNLRKQKEAVK